MEDLTLRYSDAEIRYLLEEDKEFSHATRIGPRCCMWIRPAYRIRMLNACLKGLLYQ